MKLYKHTFFVWLVGLSLLFTALPGASAQEARLDPPPPDAIDVKPAIAPDSTIQRAADGLWFMPAESRAEADAVASPDSSGGPDDFGYTWNGAVPFNWMDLGGGIDTGLGGPNYVGPIDIGFPFKYYENVRNQLYISQYGFVTFTPTDMWNDQARIPNPEKPDDVIAPHWVPVSQVAGYVRYMRGGTAPNRWFAVEWNRVRSDCCSGDGAEEYTFEAILYEDGGIIFQYGTMTRNGGYWCQSSGIEDSRGLDGLSITPFCSQIAPNHTVYIYRPAPGARVGLSPKASGAFGAPGGIVPLNQMIINNGEFGADTYDLFPASNWPIAFYQQDGVTPLIDTDSDGAPDTGPINQGGSATIVAKVTVPGGATAGQSNTAQVVVRSSLNPAKQKTPVFQTSVPPAFVQSYTYTSYPYAGLYQPFGQTIRLTGGSSSYNPAVTTTPAGQIVQVWRGGSYRNGNGQWVSELYYAVLDNRGNVIRPATRLTDLSGATTSAYDYSPAVAGTPDGRVGIAWYRYFYQNNNYNYNIYYLVLDAAGNFVVGPTSLTENGEWGSNVPQFWDPSIAATPDNRYTIAWYRYIYDGSNWFYTIWYAVRDSGGGQVRGRTQLSGNTRSYSPNLTPLADGSVFFSQRMDDEIAYSRLDSAGNILNGPTKIAGSRGYRPDAVQLPGGNIAVAWMTWGSPLSAIQYAVLNTGLGIIKSPTTLPTTSQMGDDYASVTRSGNRAVLTWGDACCNYYPNLYYALLNDTGSILTPPMIFASDPNYYTLQLPYNGQGNTFLPGDFMPPTNPTNLSSPSHTVGVWSNDNTIDTAWSGATDDDSGVDGYSTVWDQTPGTLPGTTKTIGAVNQTTSPPLWDGDWYFHMRTVDAAGNWAAGALHIGPFKVDTTPPKSVARSPRYALGAFPVSWNGTDAGSGIANYDVWVRQGAMGAWNKWQSATTALNANYAAGTVGNTYYLHSAARDQAGNVETELPPDGDTLTTLAAWAVTGRVVNSNNQPIFNAIVNAQPVMFNTAKTGGNGEYILYGATNGVYNLTASRAGYGILPVFRSLQVNGNLSGIDFVLPPEQDVLTNGGWETGSATGWTFGGSNAVVEAGASHSGSYGLNLTRSAPTLVAVADVGPTVAQTTTIPVTSAQPTLSWLYQVVAGDTNNALYMEVVGTSVTVTREVGVPPGQTGWIHAWQDLTAFQGQTVTVSFGLPTQPAGQIVYLDEISLGAIRTGNYPIRLPIILKQ